MISNVAASDWSPLLALQQATHATLQVLAADVAHLGLTPSEINALANLADGRGRTVSELGLATATRPSTLTSVLDRLAQRGLVTRGSAPGDRRAVLVELTPAGREASVTIRRAISSVERRALGDLPADVLAGLRASLAALTALAPGAPRGAEVSR